MNLLQSSSALVKRLPLYNARSNVIKRVLQVNTALFGLYLFGSGPAKLRYQR